MWCIHRSYPREKIVSGSLNGYIGVCLQRRADCVCAGDGGRRGGAGERAASALRISGRATSTLASRRLRSASRAPTASTSARSLHSRLPRARSARNASTTAVSPHHSPLSRPMPTSWRHRSPRSHNPALQPAARTHKWVQIRNEHCTARANLRNRNDGTVFLNPCEFR